MYTLLYGIDFVNNTLQFDILYVNIIILIKLMI